jgi:hypothetical protein
MAIFHKNKKSIFHNSENLFCEAIRSKVAKKKKFHFSQKLTSFVTKILHKSIEFSVKVEKKKRRNQVTGL